MEKVVRTQPEGLDPEKGLSQFLEDGWKVKMCNSIWRSNGTECLEYIITKETEEEKQARKKWFSQDNYIPCSAPPVKIPPPPRKSEEPNPPEYVKIVTGSKDSLRSGMVIQCFDDMRWLVTEINGKMYGLCGKGYISFDNYNEDLTHKTEIGGDVTYIWRLKKPIPLRNIEDLKEEDADWERVSRYAR